MARQATVEGVEVKMWVNISGRGAKVCTDARNTLNTFAVEVQGPCPLLPYARGWLR